MPGKTAFSIVVEINDRFSKQFQAIVSRLKRSAETINNSFASSARGMSTLTKEIEKTRKETDKFAKTAEGAGKKTAHATSGMMVHLKRLSHTLFSIRHVFATVIGGVIVKELIGAATRAEDLDRAFRNLAKSGGMDATAALTAMREASRGTVHDMDLMRAANNAMLLGVIKTEKDFATLAEAGRRLGKAVGRTALQGFEDLALGIGKQSRLILDNLGIIIRAEDVYRKAAAAIGKTADELTDEQKRAAFQAAAMESVRKKVASLGVDALSSSEKVAQLGVQFKQAAIELGSALLPGLINLGSSLGNIAKVLSPVVTFFTSLAGKILGDVAKAIGTVISALTTLGETTEEKFKRMAEAIADTKEEVEGLIASYRELADEQAKAAAKAASERYEKYAGTLTYDEIISEIEKLQFPLDAAFFGVAGQGQIEEFKRKRAILEKALEKAPLRRGWDLDKQMRDVYGPQINQGEFDLTTKEGEFWVAGKARFEIKKDELARQRRLAEANKKIEGPSEEAVKRVQEITKRIEDRNKAYDEWISKLSEGDKQLLNTLDIEKLGMRGVWEHIQLSKQREATERDVINVLNLVGTEQQKLAHAEKLYKQEKEGTNKTVEEYIKLMRDAAAAEEREAKKRQAAADRERQKFTQWKEQMGPETLRRAGGVGAEADFYNFYTQTLEREKGIQNLDILMKYMDQAAGVGLGEKLGTAAYASYKQYIYQMGTFTENVAQGITATFEALETTIGTVFFDAITGKMQSAKEYLRSWLSDISKALSEFMAQQAVKALIQLGAGVLTSIGLGGLGQAVRGQGGSTALGYESMGAGDIAPSSPLFPGSQHGNVFDRPTLTMVGERYHKEAVVPLTTRGKIPIEGGGGRNVNITFNIAANDTKDFDRLLMKRRPLFEDMIMSAMSDSPRVRETMRSAR